MASQLKSGSKPGETSEIRRGERPGMNAHAAQALTRVEERAESLAARGKRVRTMSLDRSHTDTRRERKAP